MLLLLLLILLLVNEHFSFDLILEKSFMLTVLCLDYSVDEVALELPLLHFIVSSWHHLITIGLHYTLVSHDLLLLLRRILSFCHVLLIITLRFGMHTVFTVAMTA